MRTPKPLTTIALEIQEWQRKQFPGSTPVSSARHLLNEAKELQESPYSLEERADIFFLMIQGVHLGDLSLAIEDKLLKNLQRNWNPPVDGVYLHVKGKHD